jgi:hypothetical protein
MCIVRYYADVQLVNASDFHHVQLTSEI